jgi:ABC-type glutathione transport system ATPase component
MVPDMISVSALPKRYGDVRAVDDLSFDVERGEVIGLLGALGAGKVTTMRMVRGAARPTTGTATFNGKHSPYLTAPRRDVGARLDAGAMHPVSYQLCPCANHRRETNNDMTTTSSRPTFAAGAVDLLWVGGWRLFRTDADR